MEEQTKQSIIAIVTVLIANWITIGPMLKTLIKTAWEKSIEWRDMQNDVNTLKVLTAALQKDMKAAHDKIRDLKK